MEKGTFIDLTADLRELATQAGRVGMVEDLLQRALLSLASIVNYDLATVLELDGDCLVVRAARGRLANHRVKAHRLRLSSMPALREVLESRRARAFSDTDHETGGDPFDGVLDLPHGHSCMVAPLFAGDRSLGLLTFDRTACEPYPREVVHLVDVYAQILALAMVNSEQAALLERMRVRLAEENEYLRQEAIDHQEVEVLETSRCEMVRRIAIMARQVAGTATPVLIRGETGTGKEVLARYIHRTSGRASRPFVRVNCAALPASLIESELFGHVKGAFTGATTSRQGRFQIANGGTLFLDEIAELSTPLQAKLLRIIEDGTFEPVGSDTTVKVDVRLIAATNVNLEEAIAAKRFRDDLFYRLNVFPITLPPLRERTEDIPLIAGRFLATLTRRTGRGPFKLSQEAIDFLMRQRWPGNIRELVNLLERATIVAKGEFLDLASLSHGVLEPRSGEAGDGGEKIVSLEEAQRIHIRRALAHCGGKIYGPGGAAALLGVKPSTLQSKMKRLGI